MEEAIYPAKGFDGKRIVFCGDAAVVIRYGIIPHRFPIAAWHHY